MDYEFQLKLQAFLDGELSEAEASEVARRLARDQEAVALLAELRNTRQAFVGVEIGVKLPESREFFWSKIRREIEREQKLPPTPAQVPIFGLLRRLLVPASAVALLGIVLAVVVGRNASAQVGEMEMLSDDMGALTYRSQSDGITMVWLYNRSDSQFTDETASGSVSFE